MKLFERRIYTGMKIKFIFIVCMSLPLYILIYKMHDVITKLAFMSEHHKFAIFTNGCKINKLDPTDSTIRDFITSPSPPLTCANREVNFVYQESNWLRFNRTAIGTYTNFSHCVYKALVRQGDDEYAYKEDMGPFYNDVHIKEEFINVKCFNNLQQEIYANLFAFILRDIERARVSDGAFKKYMSSRKPLETFNIVMIGVDSMSRSNFIRQMPKTISYLKNELQAFDLHGYNKVGDNTFVNIVPMLTGKFVGELIWPDETVDEDKPFDEYPLLWKDFSAAGYTTLFAEDLPRGAIFNYLMAGFDRKPTDKYLRPFYLALQEELSHTQRHCLGNKQNTEHVLDYLWDAMHTFKSSRIPHFCFTFITSLTHDFINDASLGDRLYESFFKKFKDEGHSNNTILLFFGDHGIRFGDIRVTTVGKFEERLPGMFVVVPFWFPQRYPMLSKNLYTNSRRLVTPFDIYETIKSILGFSGRIRKIGNKQRGISLFGEIPDSRTCGDAAIPSHYCTCHQTSEVSLSDLNVKSAVNATLTEINDLTSEYRSVCAEFILKEIIKADKDMEMFQTNTTYQVTFKVTPSDAIFEASVVWASSRRQSHILGDVSRINRYGNQSHCVDKSYLKKICFCVN